MVDEKDFLVKKYIGKDKVRTQKWYMHYCDKCNVKRSYLPRNKSGLCHVCAYAINPILHRDAISKGCKGRTISDKQRVAISKTLMGNKNAANITPQKSMERTAKRMGISIEQYIAEKELRKNQRKVRKNMLDRLCRFLRGQRKSVKYFPFTREELLKHLEDKFQPNMTWNNYGRLASRKSWEIDHVIPLRYKENNEFYWNQEELSNPRSETFKKAWSLDNLQPMWDRENWSKGSSRKGM